MPKIRDIIGYIKPRNTIDAKHIYMDRIGDPDEEYYYLVWEDMAIKEANSCKTFDKLAALKTISPTSDKVINAINARIRHIQEGL